MKKSNSLLETLLRRRLAIRLCPLGKYANKPCSPRQSLNDEDAISPDVLGTGGQSDQIGARHEATGNSKNFGLRKTYMNKELRNRLLNSCSDNLKSKSGPADEKQPRGPKWVGIFAIVIALTVCGAVATAQQPAKIFRIGYLDSGTASGSAVFVQAFLQELSNLGWIEGKNITIEYRFAEQKRERLPELAADLVRLKVDLILVSGSPIALAAKKATTTVPIVMATASDPVGEGVVASLARPGGNVTGFSGLAGQLNTKRLEILKDAVPKLARVALLRTRTPESGVRRIQGEELRPAAQALKLKLEEIETQFDAKGLERAFQTAKQKRVDAIMTISNNRFFAERKRIVELAGKHRLPAIYFDKGFVDEGGLMSYGVDYTDLFRRAAVYVDKILKGAKPADLPVQQATKFEFVISLKASKQIGLTLPPELLARANRVIR